MWNSIFRKLLIWFLLKFVFVRCFWVVFVWLWKNWIFLFCVRNSWFLLIFWVFIINFRWISLCMIRWVIVVYFGLYSIWWIFCFLYFVIFSLVVVGIFLFGFILISLFVVFFSFWCRLWYSFFVVIVFV